MPILFLGCFNQDDELDLSGLYDGPSPRELATPGPIFLNGKLKHASPLEKTFTPVAMDSIYLPPVSDPLREALHHQLELMEKKRSNRKWVIGDRRVSQNDLVENIRLFLECGDNPLLLRSQLRPYQSWGNDQRGHVKFTGYYSPVLRVRKQPDSVYRYPICRRPQDWEGPLPSFRAILRDSALAGKGLEIAYASDPVDIYQFQLQGSGYIEMIETGEQFMLEYDGSNRLPRKSIERYFSHRKDTLDLANLTIPSIKSFLAEHPAWMDSLLDYTQSYIFFKPDHHRVKGAGQAPLIEFVSAAVDQRVFPLGSILLGAIPVHDKRGNIIHHQFRLLLAQDTGGAIQGSGRVDLYCGVGEKGRTHANKYNQYGRLWVLLPPENDPHPVFSQPSREPK